MKIRTYEKKSETKEPLYLKLIDREPDAVSLVVVDKKGIPIHGGSILYINKNGISLQKYILADFGLSLDDQRRIKINPR